MSGIATAIVGGAIIGGVASNQAAKKGAKAAERAAELQSESADRAADIQLEMFNRQTELQEPWRKAGVDALNQLIPLSTQYQQFGMGQFQADPGYGFRLSEGLKALDRSAAARGGLLSGATLKGAQRYGQGLASEEYQNAFNRYQTERNARLNPLQALANVGQTSVNQLGQAGQNYASNVGNAYMSAGNAMASGMMGAANARASGYMGTANALSSALGQGLNYYQQQQYMNKLGTQSPAPIVNLTSPGGG